MTERRKPLSRVPRERLVAAIAVHEDILKRHPASSETYKYSKQSLAALRAELTHRDRKQNPRPKEGLRMAKAKRKRAVSGCYVVGRARRRRRKANPTKRPVSCYATGKGRIRRRKMNRVTVHKKYALYAHRAGRARLKFVGNSKFAAKGRAVLFRGQAEARAAAWVLKDSFPAALRGYTLKPTAQP